MYLHVYSEADPLGKTPAKMIQKGVHFNDDVCRFVIVKVTSLMKIHNVENDYVFYRSIYYEMGSKYEIRV